MNDNEANAQPGGLSLVDVYYILFRHKLLILFFSSAGILAALTLYLTKPAMYQSEAKLMIKYIEDNKSVNPIGKDSQVTSVDYGGSIIDSEMEILSSLDLSMQVVDELGAETITAKIGRVTDRNKVARFLNKNVTVESPKAGKIIRVAFQHPDPGIVQPVLAKLIEVYRKKHLEIHRLSGILDDLLSQETIKLRKRLNDTEEELRKAKAKYGVIDLATAKKSLIEEMARIRQDIFAAEAELEGRRAGIAEAEKLSPSKSPSAAQELGIPVETLNEYKSLCAQLNSYLSKKQELLAQLTPENPMVQRLQMQIKQTEKDKRKMEETNPKLASLNIAMFSSGVTNTLSFDLQSEIFRAKDLQARIKVFVAQFEKIKAEADRMDQGESEITQLERRKELEESYLKAISTGRDQAQIEAALQAGKYTNLPLIQEPSPPTRTLRKLQKPLMIILAFGFGTGIGLAFLLELFIDQTVKRPSDLLKKMRIPVMISIPDLARNGDRRFGLFRRKRYGTVYPAAGNGSTEEPQRLEVAPWEPQHGLHDYYEGLRDRLISFFELRNMTHKPKLVAITSCSKGAGVTTIATGLAAALSQTGEGNVLLVDMGLEQGAAHPFYKGKPGCGLSELLEAENREEALVHENLYMVTARNSKNQLTRILPSKFTNLVPKMKASQFDYIILDMPPISQTSATSALAGFMDMMLVVVEGEKTNREVLKQATEMISETKVNVSTVFNKGRTYVPGWLHKEL